MLRVEIKDDVRKELKGVCGGAVDLANNLSAARNKMLATIAQIAKHGQHLQRMSPIIAALSRLSQASQDVYKATQNVNAPLRITAWKAVNHPITAVMLNLADSVDKAFALKGVSVFGFFKEIKDVVTLQSALDMAVTQVQGIADAIADALESGSEIGEAVSSGVRQCEWDKLLIALQVAQRVLQRNMDPKKKRRDLHLVHVGTAEAATAAAATRGIMYCVLFLSAGLSPLASKRRVTDKTWRELVFQAASKRIELSGRQGGFSGRGWDMYENTDIQETALLLDSGTGWISAVKKRMRSAKRRLFAQFGFIKNYFSTQLVSMAIMSSITFLLGKYGFSASQLQQWAMGIAFLASLIMFNARWNDTNPQ